MVDSSCYHIVRHYFLDKDKSLFYDMAATEHLWKQRIAMVSCLYWIKLGQFADALIVAEKMLYHEHDLIHKAVDWMLLEIGKKDLEVELGFLKKHYKTITRTEHRYAIENFGPDLRKRILAG